MRSAPRAQLTLPLTLKRAKGRPVSCHTIDVSAGGARVLSERPLSIDELLAFDLLIPESDHVGGQARVLRQHGLNCYALRFENAVPIELLSGAIARAA